MMMSDHERTCLALWERVQAFKGLSEAVRYAADMWEVTLSTWDRPPGMLDASFLSDELKENVNSPLPYVSIAPEEHGLDLCSDSTVIDLGCLGGYGLYDFLQRRLRQGLAVPNLVGIDADPLSVKLAREMASLWAPKQVNVDFIQADAAELPQVADSVDLVVARLLLPYVRVGKTLRCIARVLGAGGIVLFQTHSFTYYAQRCLANWRRPARVAYYLRPIASGALLAATGRQPASPWFREVAMAGSTLTELCQDRGLVRIWTGGPRARPLLAFRKGDMLWK